MDERYALKERQHVTLPRWVWGSMFTVAGACPTMLQDIISDIRDRFSRCLEISRNLHILHT